MKFPINNKSTEKYIYALNVSPVNLMPNSELFDLKIEYDRNIYESQEKNMDILLKTKSTNNVLTNKNLKVSLEEIYVGNLNKDTTYEELYEFLSNFGNLDNLNMIYDEHKKRKIFKGYAFVKFLESSLHKKIISYSNTFSLRGRKVIFAEKLGKL
jgi:RNA recognition motif-containing protein